MIYNYIVLKKYIKKERRIKNVGWPLCDGYKDIIKYYPELKDENRKFFVILYPIFRKFQPKHGGFRYWKYGKYIGKRKLKNEYLYDDKHIDMIYKYNIYEII